MIRSPVMMSHSVLRLCSNFQSKPRTKLCIYSEPRIILMYFCIWFLPILQLCIGQVPNCLFFSFAWIVRRFILKNYFTISIFVVVCAQVYAEGEEMVGFVSERQGFKDATSDGNHHHWGPTEPRFDVSSGRGFVFRHWQVDKWFSNNATIERRFYVTWSWFYLQALIEKEWLSFCR